MNVNEFERNKPTKTYKKIRDLENELDACLMHGMNVIDTRYVFDRLIEIKEIFLTGE
jgi:hypothetical protein